MSGLSGGRLNYDFPSSKMIKSRNTSKKPLKRRRKQKKASNRTKDYLQIPVMYPNTKYGSNLCVPSLNSNFEFANKGKRFTPTNLVA